MLRVRALITSMYQFGVELRLKSPISVCLTGECTPGVRNCRRAAAIGANYVRSRTKRISCCNDIVRDSFFSSRVVHTAGWVRARTAILCRCNLLQLTKGGQRLNECDKKVKAVPAVVVVENSSWQLRRTVFLPFQMIRRRTPGGCKSRVKIGHIYN